MSNNRRRRGNNRPPLNTEQVKTVLGADQDKPFMFTGTDGKLYKLPPARDALANMEAGPMIDAALAGTEQAWIRYSLLLLQSSNVDESSMQALRSMKGPQFSKILMRWMQTAKADVGK